MLGWAIAFLIIALIAGALGFGVVAGTAFAAAKIIFIVALVAFLISACHRSTVGRSGEIWPQSKALPDRELNGFARVSRPGGW